MRYFSLFVLLLIALPRVFAVPATPKPIIAEQSDGSMMPVYLVGDESFHCYVSEDNLLLVPDDNMSFCYGTIDRDGRIVSSNILAHQASQRTASEISDILKLDNDYNALMQRHAAVNAPAPHNVPMAIGSPTVSCFGQKRGLVILVEFQDVKFTLDRGVIERKFNQHGFSDYGHIGSVSDYFADQSADKFKLSFDVIGPVTVSRDMAYYGGNKGNGSDAHAAEMVFEACRMADKSVNYADYDWNGDGEAEMVYIIYAGYAEAQGAPANTIWPHKWQLSYYVDGDYTGQCLELDGTRIDTYACSSELADTKGAVLDGIGTTCHEFSHCLGLPDLYDVYYCGGFGMDKWDLMSSGSYNGPERRGEVPCGYSAYERAFLGWIRLIELTDVCRISGMDNIADGGDAYVIYNDNNRNEYFILENRHNTRWFKYITKDQSAHGLLITHVDYNERSWHNNTVNIVRNHQRMSIVPADNDFGTLYRGDGNVRYHTTDSDLAGDSFPGSHEVTDFTNTSHYDVGGMLYNANVDGSMHLNKPLTNIRETDGLISFDFMGGLFVAQPSDFAANVRDNSSFDITWNVDGSYDSFQIEAAEVRKNPLDHQAFYEDFEHMFTEYVSKRDVSSLFDLFMSNKGWKGQYVYTSPDGAKLGSEYNPGYLISPEIVLPSPVLTVKLSGQTVEYDELRLEVQDGDGIIWASTRVRLVDGQAVCNFRLAFPGTYRVRIDAPLCTYLTGFRVYDDEFTAYELSMSSILDLLNHPVQRFNISGHTAMSYTFTGLTARKYKVRVRTCYDDAYSEWTDYMIVELNTTGIADAGADDAPLRAIYNLQGVPVRDMSAPGIYILDYGTHTRKIAVP